MKTYVVSFERDEAGWWVASVSGVAGCHTQGRSIDQARTRIRDALELAIGDVSGVRLKEKVELPRKVKQVLARREAAQRDLEEQEKRTRELTRRAVQTLVDELELSVRDAGELLGLSHQRVQQLVRG